MTRRNWAAVPILALLVACSGGQADLSREQLDWCSQNEAKVAQAALAMGLMENGVRFSDWRASNPDAYDEACLAALAGGPAETVIPVAT